MDNQATKNPAENTSPTARRKLRPTQKNNGKTNKKKTQTSSPPRTRSATAKKVAAEDIDKFALAQKTKLPDDEDDDNVDNGGPNKGQYDLW